MKRNEIDMTQGPLARKILEFALPLAASSVLQQLFNVADLAVVGNFSTSQAMAAVGSNAAVIALFVSLFTGLSVGANVLIASLIGAGKRDRIGDAVQTVISVALLSGILLLFAGLFAAKPLLVLMNAPRDVLSLAILYLRIYFCGMPAFMLYNFGSAVLRSKGDSRRPFYYLTTGGIVNVLLNLIFVAVFHLHVIGVALATVLSNCLSAALILRALMRETGEFTFSVSGLRIHTDLLLQVIRTGVPAGLQGVVFSLSNVIIQSAVNGFGSSCVAGMTAAQNFDFVGYCMTNAFAQTCVTFTSQNYGAQKTDRCSRVRRICLMLAIDADLVYDLLVVIFRHRLILLFTHDPAVIEFAMIRIVTTLSVHFLTSTYEITGGALRGRNHSMLPALISILGTCGVRLLYVWYIFPRYGTPHALVLVYPITWIVTGLVMNVAYYLVISARKPS